MGRPHVNFVCVTSCASVSRVEH